MNEHTQRASTIACGAMLALLVGFPAVADDIEIYVGGATGTGAKPNVLLVVDTSGSMNSTVDTQGAYDAGEVYPGCFSTDRTYFGFFGSVPTNCATPDSIPNAQNRCAASSSMNTTGFYSDRFALRLDGFWFDPRFVRDFPGGKVECNADGGVHGDNAGDAARWASDGANAWSALAADEIDWAAGRAVTVYSGNYLNYFASAGLVQSTRIQVVQDVVEALVNSVNGVNMGLMRFDANARGGMVTAPLADITTSRATLTDEVRSYNAAGNTPLSETLYEAMLYFRGDNVDFGLASTPVPSVSTSRVTGNQGQYQSPLQFQCQKSFVILLTDGEPTADDEVNSAVPALPGFGEAVGKAACTNDHGIAQGICLDEIAEYMHEVDQSGTLNGEQTVETYTIGFALNHPLLNGTAAVGGGRNFRADDATSLTAALLAIFDEVLASDGSFTAPAVSVNAFNRTTQRDDLYFALFKPASTPHWDGNVKKYRLDINSPNADIVDALGQVAVDPATGQFKGSALSFWTDAADLPAGVTADGNDAELGGAAGELDANRTIYTYTGAGKPANVLLTGAPHRLHESNTAITELMLGLTGNTISREDLIRWARGLDVDQIYGRPDGSKPIMGDPLHSRPTVVQYGGTVNSPDLTVFVTTNDGYFHAFDAATGEEQFAFVPQASLERMFSLYQNTVSTVRPYGLDGTLTTWVRDNNDNGDIEIANGDRVVVFFGMRRGGSNYYALDVTNRGAPRLLWRIEGGVDADYQELGQTWSDPKVAKMKVNNADTTVLIFGGGYDLNQDNATVRSNDSIGRALFVVDAETGQRLWWAGPSGSGADLILTNMTNSIPSAVTAIDTDVEPDELVDILYVADTGGQVWRFDVDNDNAVGLKIQGGRIAKLSQESSTAHARRFYYPPDVSYEVEAGKPSYLALALGSGFRAHPLDRTIQDRLYMLRDTNVFNPPTTYTTLTEADLFDATDNVVQEGTQAQRNVARTDLASKKGWFIVLNEPNGGFVGEKVLAEALIVEGTAIFTTFAPIKPTDPCLPDTGRGAVYFVDVSDATPTQEFDEVSGKTRADRRILLKRGGIPPSPTLVITERGNANLVGTEMVPDPTGGRPVKTYWFKQ